MSRQAKRYKYRCARHGCRTRNSFVMKLEWYVRPRKCRTCGNTTFYLDKEMSRRRRACTCQGCHYPHRPGSSVCLDNPFYGIERWADDGGATYLVDGAESDVPF